MKKIISLSIGIILCGCSMVSQSSVSVHDFDSCVAAGNAIMESFPEQCSHEGITYVNTPQTIEMANPASTFCVEQGGTVEIRDEQGGQVGYCRFVDGTEMEEWAYFREQNTPETIQLEIPEGCETWFDGCNNCMVGEGDMLACTRMFCSPEMTKPARCIKFLKEEEEQVKLILNEMDCEKNRGVVTGDLICSFKKPRVFQEGELIPADYVNGDLVLHDLSKEVCENNNGTKTVDGNGISVCLVSLDKISQIIDQGELNPMKEPRICTMDYTPVCGINGVTYGNKCGAGDVEIDYEGECQ